MLRSKCVEVTISEKSDMPRMDGDQLLQPEFHSGTPVGVLDGKLCILEKDRDGLGQFWCFDPEDACWERLPRTDGSHHHRAGVCAAVLH